MNRQPATVVSCPHCRKDFNPVIDDLILIPLPDAMVYLVMPTLGAMYTALWRYKHLLDPPQYAYDSDGRRHRMLTLHDMRVLRARKRMSLQGVMKWMKSGMM